MNEKNELLSLIRLNLFIYEIFKGNLSAYQLNDCLVMLEYIEKNYRG